MIGLELGHLGSVEFSKDGDLKGSKGVHISVV